MRTLKRNRRIFWKFCSSLTSKIANFCILNTKNENFSSYKCAPKNFFLRTTKTNILKCYHMLEIIFSLIKTKSPRFYARPCCFFNYSGKSLIRGFEYFSGKKFQGLTLMSDIFASTASTEMILTQN